MLTANWNKVSIEELICMVTILFITVCFDIFALTMNTFKFLCYKLNFNVRLCS